MNTDEVLRALDHVYDPDRPDKSVVELGIVKEDGISVDQDTVSVTYCIRSPLCPYSAALGVLMKRALEQLADLKVQVQIDEGHFQAKAVNEILSDETKFNELAHKMEDSGLFNQSLRP